MVGFEFFQASEDDGKVAGNKFLINVTAQDEVDRIIDHDLSKFLHNNYIANLIH